MPGGALLAIGAWFQLAILLWKIDFTFKNQLTIFLYFLTIIPLYLILGTLATFLKIYLNQMDVIKFLLLLLIQLFFIFLNTQLSVLNFKQMQISFNLNAVFKNSFKNINAHLKTHLLVIIATFIFYFLPVLPKIDFKISLIIILTHLYIQRQHLKNLTF